MKNKITNEQHFLFITFSPLAILALIILELTTFYLFLKITNSPSNSFAFSFSLYLGVIFVLYLAAYKVIEETLTFFKKQNKSFLFIFYKSYIKITNIFFLILLFSFKKNIASKFSSDNDFRFYLPVLFTIISFYIFKKISNQIKL